MRPISVTRAFSTSLAVEKATRLAEITGVSLAHLDTRFAGRGKWVNDYEVTGPAGKVEKFLVRIDDLRTD